MKYKTNSSSSLIRIIIFLELYRIISQFVKETVFLLLPFYYLQVQWNLCIHNSETSYKIDAKFFKLNYSKHNFFLNLKKSFFEYMLTDMSLYLVLTFIVFYLLSKYLLSSFYYILFYLSDLFKARIKLILFITMYQIVWLLILILLIGFFNAQGLP